MFWRENLNIYLDESGDLGFKPRGTNYFTIAFIVTENRYNLKRCVKRTKRKFKIPPEIEIKGSATRKEIKEDLFKRIGKLQVEIHSITVKKKNVKRRLRQDTNILYNYMVGLSLVERILEAKKGETVTIVVDRRIISITSGFNFNEYIRYKVWYDGNRQDIELNICHVDSHKAFSIQAIDVICNSVFRKYQRKDSSLIGILQKQGKVKTEKRLFFSI